ncbi:GntR family transcriptional regulator [Pseudoroseomonas rhizosphaerae]|uniref:GntR family transcriptional regulator n=1 Tax=Teichococcus rhizosphaerae TaxID=1335062 RepID=A0A2C7A5R1_9PROT|nr:GntR family transcriptional regulator [Pseudoroseomonas rhizosphaerae]PHK95428.1 GntR family transcriptional regulator [Pseudoroseomonas rhizosphaerae]
MTKDMALRVVPRPMRKQVEEGLRDAIMTGRFAPGQHLPDRLLCELFGASRSVVREAVRLLEAEGLVTTYPNRGPFVSFLSPAEAEQVYEVRGVLEALAGEGFAQRASAGERAELRRVLEALAALPPRGADQAALLALKREFYEVLMRGCRNPLVARMFETIINRNAQLRATSLSDPGRLSGTVAELRRVVEAIEARDAAGAWQACRDHVRSAAEVALRILREHERAARATG